MHNQIYRVLVFSALFLIIFASCTLPTDRNSGGSNPPVEPPQEEPTIHVEEPPAPVSPPEPTIQVEEPPEPVSNSEPIAPVAEEPPAGGGGSSVEPGAQNPLPPAVNLEQSSIDLEKLGKATSGGGGGAGIGCGTVFKDKTEPEIILHYSNKHWTLCFIKFPLGTALVKLSTRSGLFEATVNLEPEFDESFYLNPEFDGVEAYDMHINLPAQIVRDGPLKVEISAGGVTMSKEFDLHTIDRVSIYQATDETHLNLVSKNSDFYWNEPHFEFQAGNQIEIFRVNLQPSTPVFVGIYGASSYSYSANVYYHLIEQFEVTTNRDGEFLGAFSTSAKYHQGNYVIYYGYEPNLLETAQRKSETNNFEWFSITSNLQTWQPCTANYPSRLRAGDIGMVSDSPPLPNSVRNIPSLSGEIFGQLQPGEQFIILDGPVCEGGWVWWYVRSDSNAGQNEALIGWTSEGDLNNYWLVPYNPEEPKG